MRRREVIAGLSSFAAAYPTIGGAQQATKLTLGVLTSHSASSVEPYLGAMRESLATAGFTEGQNLAIEYRWAEGHYDRLPSLARELVARTPALIIATGAVVSARAAQEATASIPIVFVVGGDPITFRLVESLNRPGGNVTGVSMFSYQLDAKRLELLHELAPQPSVIGILLNPTSPQYGVQWEDIQTAARQIGREIIALRAATDVELDQTLAGFREQGGALLVSSEPFFQIRRERIVAFAARHRIAAVYPWREYVEAGGLLSYGPSLLQAYRQAGQYASRIFGGEHPAELPVVRPTQFELVLNLKTAKSLGIAVPLTVQTQADEVIE